MNKWFFLFYIIIIGTLQNVYADGSTIEYSMPAIGSNNGITGINFTLEIGTEIVQLGARGGTLPAMFYNKNKNAIEKTSWGDSGKVMNGYLINDTLYFPEKQETKIGIGDTIKSLYGDKVYSGEKIISQSITIFDLVSMKLLSVSSRFNSLNDYEKTISVLTDESVSKTFVDSLIIRVAQVVNWKIHSVSVKRYLPIDTLLSINEEFQVLSNALFQINYSKIRLDVDDTLTVVLRGTKGILNRQLSIMKKGKRVFNADLTSEYGIHKALKRSPVRDYRLTHTVVFKKAYVKSLATSECQAAPFVAARYKNNIKKYITSNVSQHLQLVYNKYKPKMLNKSLELNVRLNVQPSGIVTDVHINKALTASAGGYLLPRFKDEVTRIIKNIKFSPVCASHPVAMFIPFKFF